MKRTLLITMGATLAAVTWGVLLRGELAYGGEMILPLLAIAYALLTQEAEDEKEPR